MSFFNEVNEDATSIAPETVATGPRAGFFESFAVSYEQQVRGAAVRGIEDAMWRLESDQVAAMRKAGIEDVPVLTPSAANFWSVNPSNAYLDTAKFYEDGGDPAIAGQLTEFDKRIEDLRKTYPDLNLRTSREMWGEVQSKAQEFEQRGMTGRRDFMGEVGAFAGGAIGSLNPNTDPLNFATLGVGGVGKTAIARIASQAGAQGVIETLNQATGVQEQRRLLGLDYGLADAASRVVGTVVGGAAVQGVGEIVGMGVRRWFRNTPTDAAPALPDVPQRPVVPDTSRVPPQAIPADETLGGAKLTNAPETYIDYLHEQSPFSQTRAGRQRTVLDLDYVTARLEDWTAERPWEITPKTDTAPIRPNSDFVNIPDMDRIVQRAQVDDIARSVDPDTFRQYDALAQRKQTYRRWLDELSEGTDTDIAARIEAVDTQIFDLATRAEETGGKRAAKLRKDIAALEAQKRQIVEEAAGKETPDMARVRRELMRDDEKMRDLAPLVSRAYARAENRWRNTDANRQEIAAMMREGRTEFRPDEQAQRVADSMPDEVPQTIADRAPILREADKVQGKVAADADAADIARAIVAEHAKVMDEALETYRTSIDGLLEAEPPASKVEIADFTDEEKALVLTESAEAFDAAQAGVREAGLSANSLPVLDDKNVWIELDARQDTVYEAVSKAKEGKPRKVSVSTLSTRQNWVSSSKSKNPDAPITVVSIGGKMVVRDGNHRVAEAIARGAKSIEAHVAEVELSGTNWSPADIQLNGQAFKLNLDKDTLFIPNEQGTGGREVTVRELLEQHKNDEYELEAVSSCSLRKTS